MTFLKQGELGAAATEKELSVGDYIWRLTYDLFQRSGEPRHINQPEAIGAIITKLIFSPYRARRAPRAGSDPARRGRPG